MAHQDWQEQYLSRAFLERKKRVVLVVGEESFTSRELRKFLGDVTFTMQAVSRLNSRLLKFRRLKAENFLDLASKISLDDLFDAGCGEASIEVWNLILHKKGVHPIDWMDCSVKINTRAQARKKENK